MNTRIPTERQIQKQKERESKLNSTFMANVTAGITAGAAQCLDLGADIEYKSDPLKTTALYHAIDNYDLEMATLLLDRHASTENLSQNAATPLHSAAFGDFYEGAKLLIARCANTNARRLDGVTPLHLANANTDITQLLLENDAEILADDNGDTALHFAAKTSASTVSLLMQHGADPFQKNKFGESALEIALKNNQVDVFEVMVSHEENIKRILPLAQQLQGLVKKTQQTTLQKQLQKFIDLQAELNASLLEGVRDKFYTDAIEALSNGANPLCRDEHGNTAAHFAAQNNDVEMLTLLRKYDTQMTSQNKNGYTPLMVAAKSGHTATVDLLLKAGNKDDIPGKHGTALQIAIRWGQLEVIQLILQNKQAIIKSSPEGLGLLDIAVKFHQPTALDLLLNHFNYFLLYQNSKHFPFYFCVQDNKLNEETAMVFVKHLAKRACTASISTIILDLSTYEASCVFLLSRFILALVGFPERFTPIFRDCYIKAFQRLSFKQRDLIKSELVHYTETLTDAVSKDLLCSLALDKAQNNAFSAFIHIPKTIPCRENSGALGKFSMMEARSQQLRQERKSTLQSIAENLRKSVNTNDDTLRQNCLEILRDLYSDTNDIAIIELIERLEIQLNHYTLRQDFSNLLNANQPMYPTFTPEPSAPPLQPPPYASIHHNTPYHTELQRP